MVSETMAARGLVNGRGPPRSGGRDSAKRVVSETIPLQVFFNKLPRCPTRIGIRIGLNAGECGIGTPDERM